MSKKITVELLRRLGACQEERDFFAKLFPDGTEVTVELCVKHAGDFDWSWAAEELLTFKAYDVYDADMDTVFAAQREAEKPIDAEYSEAMKPYEDAYQKVATEARRALEAAEELAGYNVVARKAYGEALEAVNAEYSTGTASIRERFHGRYDVVANEFKKGQATAFANAFLSEANVVPELEAADHAE